MEVSRLTGINAIKLARVAGLGHAHLLHELLLLGFIAALLLRDVLRPALQQVFGDRVHHARLAPDLEPYHRTQL